MRNAECGMSSNPAHRFMPLPPCPGGKRAFMNHRNLRTSRWGILWVSYLGIIAFALVFQSFSPVLDLMISGIGLTHGQAGALMSYFALPGILSPSRRACSPTATARVPWGSCRCSL